MPSYQNISVIGAGAWGTALANAAARAGRNVTLYARDPVAAEAISRTRENPKLPNIHLAKSVSVTSDMAQAADSDAVLLVTPAQNLRARRDIARAAPCESHPRGCLRQGY